MPKLLIHIMAVLVVPSLIGDPAYSAVAAIRGASIEKVFTAQALAESSLFVHPAREPASGVDRQLGAAFQSPVTVMPIRQLLPKLFSEKSLQPKQMTLAGLSEILYSRHPELFGAAATLEERRALVALAFHDEWPHGDEIHEAMLSELEHSHTEPVIMERQRLLFDLDPNRAQLTESEFDFVEGLKGITSEEAISYLDLPQSAWAFFLAASPAKADAPRTSGSGSSHLGPEIHLWDETASPVHRLGERIKRPSFERNYKILSASNDAPPPTAAAEPSVLAAGMIIAVGGQSGAGVTTLLNLLLDDRKDLIHQPTYTTREPRRNEMNGVDYYFVTREEFDTLLGNGNLLTADRYEGNNEWYGIPTAVFSANEGLSVAMAIEVWALPKLREVIGRVVSIFVSAQKETRLSRLLQDRLEISEEEINSRLAVGEAELKVADQFDYHIVNERFQMSQEALGQIADHELGLDFSRVGASDNFSEDEVKALRNAARRLNLFLREGAPINEANVHKLQVLAAENSLIKIEEFESPDIGTDPAEVFFPHQLLGHYRDGKTYSMPVRFRDGAVHDATFPFDLHIWEEWADVQDGFHVQDQMTAYFGWLESALRSEHDAIGVAAEAYVRFVKVHPYIDVNDRLAWLIMNWVLLQKGHSPFYVTAVNQSAYLDAGAKVMKSPLNESIREYKNWFRGEYAASARSVSPVPLSRREARAAA